MMRRIMQWFIPLVFLGITRVSVAQDAQRDTLQELQRRVEILSEEIERLKLGEVAEPQYTEAYGLGPAASKVYRVHKGASLAGYGEVVYDNFFDEKDDGTPSGKKDQTDYLRNVVYVGFKYSDRVLFNSEIEFEHGSTGRGGEVSMEFGYVDLMLKRYLNVRAGMVLPPVGITNERHEPSTFHGTARPDVERLIIPTTWRANGFGLFGEIAQGLTYRAYMMEGLDMRGFSASNGIRGGRQNGARSFVEDFGWVGRLEYTRATGGSIGGSFYTGKAGQGTTDPAGEIGARTTLWDLHGEYLWEGWEVRGLYARVTVDDVGRVNAVNKFEGDKSVGEEMVGWYIVAAYDLLPRLLKETTHAFAPFIRYERYNTQRKVPAGFTLNPANDRTVLTVGITYKPHPNVALKGDYQNRTDEAETAVDQFSFAVNYLY